MQRLLLRQRSSSDFEPAGPDSPRRSTSSSAPPSSSYRYRTGRGGLWRTPYRPAGSTPSVHLHKTSSLPLRRSSWQRQAKRLRPLYPQKPVLTSATCPLIGVFVESLDRIGGPPSPALAAWSHRGNLGPRASGTANVTKKKADTAAGPNARVRQGRITRAVNLEQISGQHA